MNLSHACRSFWDNEQLPCGYTLDCSTFFLDELLGFSAIRNERNQKKATVTTTLQGLVSISYRAQLQDWPLFRLYN